jgi:hypothetical protein
MALPLPRVVADVGPGGPLVTSLGGINSLANDMTLRKINEIKAKYAPLTTQAEAASKLAYANLMGPQFMAKLMANPGFLGNTPDNKLQAIREMITRAGTGQGQANALAQLQGQGQEQPEDGSFTGWLKNSLKNTFSRPQQEQAQAPSNPLAQDFSMPQAQTQSQPQAVAQENPMQHRPKDGVTLEGAQWYNAKGEPVYEEEETTPDGSMKLELTKGIPPKSYAENTGNYQGTVKQKEQEGKYRADALHAIGQSQIGLSNSGAVLDRLTGLITNPVFANMRNRIPGFQNKQLDYLKVMGTPEEKELIGDFLATGESFIASTVQGFSGKPLVREFDLAQRQKITPHDTIESATGKLRSARALHDIAEKKNQIVSELLQKGYNESDAIKYANKMVDVSAIEKETNKLLQRRITIRNGKTGEEKSVTIEEARKLGVPNV